MLAAAAASRVDLEAAAERWKLNPIKDVPRAIAPTTIGFTAPPVLKPAKKNGQGRALEAPTRVQHVSAIYPFSSCEASRPSQRTQHSRLHPFETDRLLRRSELRNKLRRIGLNAKGTQTELIERLVAYYKANPDSL